jgi:F-type H+-transporting ATPase subunit delta
MEAKGHLARRYAQAIFELDKERIAEWQAGLEKVSRLSQDTVVATYLESPAVHFQDKTRLLHEKLGEVSPFVLNLVYHLLTRSRLEMVPDIAAEYGRLVDSYQGIERAQVITAVPLDDEDRLKLSQKLGDIIGKKVIIESESVDPDLIGGVVVRVAGKLMDGSIRSKLAALQEEIAKT